MNLRSDSSNYLICPERERALTNGGEHKSILDKLKEYSEQGSVPMHMPGHKRNVSGIAFLKELGAKYDISEIEGFDNLHAPKGLLLEAMERAAELWGSDKCCFLINGSTGGILAAVRATAKLSRSGKLIMARNCHMSVYNAVELCGLEPIYISPPTVEGFSFCGSIPVRAVEKAVRDNPGTPVILTSPSYEGVISNIPEIAVICHMYGSVLIVDEAHGAHLGLYDCFTDGAVKAGADIVIQSLHKTLTGLTQTGLLHCSDYLVPPEAVEKELAVFESSSPSYLLMASIDGTTGLIKEQGKGLFRAWDERLDLFDKRVSELKTLRTPGHGELFDCQFRSKLAGFVRRSLPGEEIYDFDRSKIVISCEGTDTTGVELMNALRDSFGIECEMASGGYLLAMTGILDEPRSMDHLAFALSALDGETQRTAPRIPFVPPAIPPRSMGTSEAMAAPAEPCSLRDAVGRISAEYVWSYPPGIPLVVPGEKLTNDLLSSMIILREAGVSLQSTNRGMPKRIMTLK